MYRRPVTYAEGETIIACSICGFPYLFPSEMTYTDERTFRCNRTCLDNETITAHNRRRSGYATRGPDSTAPLIAGLKPSWRT
jgi:hypothetical protein